MKKKSYIFTPRREIIDCHAHLPGSIYKTRQPLIPKTTDESVRRLKKAGITRAVASFIGAVIPKSAAELDKANRATARECNRHRSFLIPSVMVNPKFMKVSLQWLDRAHRLGWRHVGEICGYLAGHDYRGKDFSRLMQKAAEFGLVINIHAPLDEAVRLAQAHPGARFIFAHYACIEFQNMPDIGRLKPYGNACVDVSGTATFRTGVPEYAIRTLGPERVIFGTDWFVDDPLAHVRRMETACRSERERKLIFAGNIKRLME